MKSTVELGKICEFIKGVTFDLNEVSSSPQNDYLPILRAGNISDKLNTKSKLIWIPKSRVSEQQKMQKDDIAICMSSGSSEIVGKTARLNYSFNGSVGAFCGIIRPKSPETASYISHWFLSSEFLRWRDSKARGANIQNLSFSAFGSIPILFPSPDEQKRIAAILDKADRLRRQRRFVQTLSDSFLQSVFIKMFGDIFKNEKDFEIGELGQKLSFMTSGSRGWAEHYTAKGDLFLRIQNVNKGELLLNDIAFVQAPDTAEAKRTKVKEGDVLLTITAALGRSAVIPKSLPTAYINQHIALLRVKDINPTFVSHFITSKSGQKQIEMLDREGVKSGLNFDDIKGINILLPPLPLQEKFAEIVQKFERVRRQQREATRQADHLFQTLLHRAFRGEL